MSLEYDTLRKLTKKIIAKKFEIITPKSNTQYLIGAICLDKNGNVLSYGFNSYSKTHPLQKYYAQKTARKQRIYLHAEISAIVKARKEIDTIIVARILQSNFQYAIAKPCPICSLAIKEAGIRKVYFTNNFNELVLMQD